MPRSLPQIVFDILPPLFVGFARVLSRFDVSTGDLLTLYFLRSSPRSTTIEGRRVMLLTDLLEAICSGMGYSTAAPASELLTKLNNRGLVQKVTIKDRQREQHFPEGKRNAAVFLNPQGHQLFDDISSALEAAAEEFLE